MASAEIIDQDCARLVAAWLCADEWSLDEVLDEKSDLHFYGSDHVRNNRVIRAVVPESLSSHMKRAVYSIGNVCGRGPRGKASSIRAISSSVR